VSTRPRPQSDLSDKLENAVVELERRRITRDEAAKAARAMEALEVKEAPAAVSATDAEYIVGSI
jgi:hypothetical protein